MKLVVHSTVLSLALLLSQTQARAMEGAVPAATEVAVSAAEAVVASVVNEATAPVAAVVTPAVVEAVVTPAVVAPSVVEAVVTPAVAPVAPVVLAPTVTAALSVEPIAPAVASPVKAAGFGAKVGEFFGSVKAQLPSMPSKEQAVAAIKNAPKATVEFAKAHPYKTAAIVAATAAVVYAVYKVCTSKKANKKIVAAKKN